MSYEGCRSGHYWHGTSACSECGARLRCDFCHCYVREDNIDAHYEKCVAVSAALEGMDS